jgi:hypothetical protein
LYRVTELGVRVDLLTFDYEEARKPGKTEAPAKFAEKCRNGFHHRDTEDTEVEGFLSVGEVPTKLGVRSI